MNLKLKQNIGMSVHIDIEVTENEIKNEKCVSCIMHNASCMKKKFNPLPTFKKKCKQIKYIKNNMSMPELHTAPALSCLCGILSKLPLRPW